MSFIDCPYLNNCYGSDVINGLEMYFYSRFIGNSPLNALSMSSFVGELFERFQYPGLFPRTTDSKDIFAYTIWAGLACLRECINFKKAEDSNLSFKLRHSKKN